MESAADGVAGLGRFTVQADFLSIYSHYPLPYIASVTASGTVTHTSMLLLGRGPGDSVVRVSD